MKKIGFIGMGEAGSALVSGWGSARADQIVAFDIKLDTAETAQEIVDRCDRLGISVARAAEAAVQGADIVFCTVTADQAVAAAEGAAPHLRAGTFWCDLNSCAPSSKQNAAAIIEAAGGRYVDVAVMAPVHPKLNMVPVLIAGPHAEAVAPVLEALPMSLRLVEGDVGAASSIKMIRSVMVKGLEALTAECSLAAIAAGVEGEVFGSLAKSHPGVDWTRQAAYNFERSLVHGERRAAEMEEVAKTLSDLGLPNDMAMSTVKWQRRIAATKVPAPTDPNGTDLRAIAAAVLPKIRDWTDH